MYYKHTLPFTPITAEEEIALFEKWKSEEDFAARDRIIEAHLRYALSEGVKAARGRLPEDDVTSAANAGLMKAIYRFCPVKAKAKKARFAAFARKYIRGQVMELFKDLQPQNMSLDAILADETCHASNSPVANAPAKMWLSGGGKLRTEVSEQLTAPTEDIEQKDFVAVWGERAKRAMAKLSPSHRQLIQQIAVEGKTMAAVGREQTPPVTRAAVRTRYQRAMAQLKGLVQEYAD